MPFLVTSASGANGDGFGALLTFELDGTLRGKFIDDDRIVDPRGLAQEPPSGLEKLSVVLEIMDADLESVVRKPTNERRRDRIGALGDEVERGPESHLHFELRELAALGQALRALDVMGEHNCEFLAFRPSRPPFRRFAG